jgi:hypothetical protein
MKTFCSKKKDFQRIEVYLSLPSIFFTIYSIIIRLTGFGFDRCGHYKNRTTQFQFDENIIRLPGFFKSTYYIALFEDNRRK